MSCGGESHNSRTELGFIHHRRCVGQLIFTLSFSTIYVSCKLLNLHYAAAGCGGADRPGGLVCTNAYRDGYMDQ
jgi:hypothetical protein